MNEKCKHKESGANGIIEKSLNATKDFPKQWGIRWERGTQLGKFHPYWNNINEIIKQQRYEKL